MTSSYYAKKAVFGESMMKALLMSSLMILISAAAVDVEKEEHLRLHQQYPANHRNTQTTDSSNNSSCIEVSIFLDEYPADTRWDIFDDPPPVNTTTAEPLVTSPTYNESMALTQQTTQICTLDTPGNYSFIIYDNFFDGICCEWGNGSYAVMLVNTGEVLASGGQWTGPSESTRFVLDGPPTTSTAAPTSAPTSSAPTSKMSNNTVEGDEASSTTTQTETLRTTCEIYVSIFACLFVIFLLVRPKYPRFYNIKKSYANLSTPIAQESYGHVSWIWKVFSQFSYEMIADQCGMDAVTTIRLLEFGVKLSAVGVFNSIYLMPIYSSMGNIMTSATSLTSDYNNITQANDPVVAVSLSNLPQGSNAAYATTFSAYIFFGFAMYFIAKDFQWFTSLRHDFLSKERVQNYTVYLSGLPKELQSNAAIRDYFSHCFSHNENIVADVALALKIPNLEKKSQKRNKILPKLEHAINVKEVKGETPFHKTKLCGEQKESIPTWTKELEDLNLEISEEIARIELLQATRVAGSNEIMREESNEAKADDVEVGISVAETTMPLQSTKSSVVSSVSGTMKSATGAVAGGVKSSVSMAKSLLAKNEDGMTRSAAFISFTEILYANLARQALHSKSAWKMVPSEPPLPELVNWKNVGQPASSRQIGELLSLLLTGVLCIFWTIPVSFFASLGNVSKLTEVMPFLAEPVKTYPWFSALLSQLAPLILVVFIALLPHILLVFCKLELLIEIESMQHPSLFNKLASFTILQTFFISTIASTLFTSLEAISKDPSMAITLVAKALPSQSAYLIQIVIVQNLLGIGTELLRISPIVNDLLRRVVGKILGHDLTDKERNETFLGLRSLDDPLEHYYGRVLGSNTILLQMVLYVYACMSPITTYFCLFIFGVLAIGFRNQFIFIYPIANDSGGKLWLNFVKISIVCMILAEIILFAVLLLSQAYIPAFLLLPLIVTSILFDIYLKRRHFMVTAFLPVRDCALTDQERESGRNEGLMQDWLKGSYLQPALKERFKEVSGENRGGKREEVMPSAIADQKAAGEHKSEEVEEDDQEEQDDTMDVHT